MFVDGAGRETAGRPCRNGTSGAGAPPQTEAESPDAAPMPHRGAVEAVRPRNGEPTAPAHSPWGSCGLARDFPQGRLRIEHDQMVEQERG